MDVTMMYDNNPHAAGIKSTNVLHCLHGSVSPSGRSLDGVAVVSDIVASTDPLNAARKIANIVNAFKTSTNAPVFSLSPSPYVVDTFKQGVGVFLSAIKKFSPLVHQVRGDRSPSQ